MGRSPARWLSVIGAVLVLLAWPREATLGTYGSYTLVRRGYTLAADINVGSYSDHDHEAVVFRKRQSTIDAQVKPLLPLYERWYERALTQKHPYTAWLGALDRKRDKPQEWDYKSRLWGPVRRTPAVARGALKPGEPPGLADSLEPPAPIQLYLHMRTEASELSRGRALVGFVLAQIALGDTPELALPDGVPGDTRPLAQRVDHAAHADSFSGQARVVASLLFVARTQAAELTRLVDDPAQPAEVRLLARLCVIGLGHGLGHDPWAPADWPLVVQAKGRIDARTLWTWVLLFTPESEQAARESELRQHLPLSADHEPSFVREFVQGRKG